MQHDLAFLHTSPAHVPTFTRLAQELAPGLRVRHVVDESLLADAQQRGVADAALVARVHQAMHGAASTGARVVVCTCSTVGGAAERTPTQGAFTASRIDRAMADRAVGLGPRVLVVAALASTLAPTTGLIQESAVALGLPVQVHTLQVKGAWALFEQGDTPGYLNAIAAAVRGALALAEAPPDAVVLAQASMALAAPALADLGMQVLASPRLGVQQAVAQYERGPLAGVRASGRA